MPTRRASPSQTPIGVDVGCAPPVGLILTGGGARAAYQVGVLSGVLDILDPQRSGNFKNPFAIICGSSAGAINAASLACGAHSPHTAVEHVRNLWESLTTDMVYRSSAGGLIYTGLRWFAMLSAGWLFPSLRSRNPRSFLDNAPLGRLLSSRLDFNRLHDNIARGYLQALAITATGYTSGQHLTFYQSHNTIQPWRRSLRRAVSCSISVDHVMASSSIPFIFAARPLALGNQVEWCGDGSMRQLAPMSPAIHLGAKKIFVIGTGYKDDIHPELRHANPGYPSLAQIGGHALSNIFLDSLSMDIERMERINELLAQLPINALQNESLRTVSTFSITPSRSLDEIAMSHLDEMPRAARALFRVLGVSPKLGSSDGGALISYLLFEASYTRELISLGRADSLSRTEEVKAFFKETPK